ncbi:septum formation initiator family protein [uncultured Brachyspira sp.]|uniref:FtsB family cell division protein n=1 Tax=uncultured Brachyspira sp. TaxID=221953 RepID=UPI0027DE92F5|nr:septum formation initiator family protein [uncultured Brachyspira sp.]
MYCKIRVKAGIFYGIILIGIIFTVFIFVFSPKGFGNLDSKKELLKIRKEKIAELNREKIQITSNIERLKTDREYIISYAKTFGYLDSSKNEKIIKIIKDEEVKDLSTAPIQKYSSDKEIDINIKRIIILSLVVFILLFIIYFNRQKYSSSNQNHNINNG